MENQIISQQNKQDEAPIHPGFLVASYIKEAKTSHGAAARAMGVPKQSVSFLTNGKKSISPSIAVRLGKLLGTTTEFWLNKQAAYDAKLAEREIDTSNIPTIRAA